MSKDRKIRKRPAPRAKQKLKGGQKWVIVGLVGVLLAGGAAIAIISTKGDSKSVSIPRTTPAADTAGSGAAGNLPTTSPAQPAAKPPNSTMESMEVAKAVMVTVELEFGSHIPTIEEALKQVERRYAPDDGTGRTFAILDAYGEPTPDGKKLHMSMHVSSEKPGMGSLVFRRTGEVLWQSRINASTAPPPTPYAGKKLTIMVDNGAGRGLLIDGTKDPRTVLEANVTELGMPLQAVWPDGVEREVTFIYSMCGCPVKVMARRVGQRTVRTKELPVIFPDDPAVVSTISKLMGW